MGFRIFNYLSSLIHLSSSFSSGLESYWSIDAAICVWSRLSWDYNPQTSKSTKSYLGTFYNKYFLVLSPIKPEVIS